MRSTLYVSNVASAADLGALEDLFMTVGDVQGSSVEVIPESGHRLGFGVFEMSTEQQASDCIERFNGKNLNGKLVAIVSERPAKRRTIKQEIRKPK